MLSALTLAAATIHPSFTQVIIGPVSVGSLSIQEFDRINQQGDVALSEVRPATGPISSADEKLLGELAIATRIQLETSRIAVSRALRPNIRAFAIAEVDEQIGMSKKLAEVAAAKGVSLPSNEGNARAKASKLAKIPAQKFDEIYIREIGIEGHEAMKKLVNKIDAKAENPTLRQLAAAVSPIILTHLQVAQAEADIR